MALLVAALIALAVPGCVELTGQRISWLYDSAKDELQILIHYDGVHDSGGDEHGTGVEQIPQFVQHGSVMLLDWPFHLDMASVKETIDNEQADAQEKDWARLIASIQTKPIGFYREPDGHLGAAQLVTIPQAQGFVRKLNGLISQQILGHDVNPDSSLAHTMHRMQQAARDGHQWITLDGQAIRFTMPVHPDEWARAKGEFLNEFAKTLAQGFGTNADQEKRRSVKSLFGLLASMPVSYVDRGTRVEFVLGRPDTTSTARLYVRDEYEPSLEKVVAETLKVDLDDALATALLDQQPPHSTELSAVLDFGPPEERVRALMAAADRADQSSSQAAIDKLASWSDAWNREHRVPKAPPKTDHRKQYLAAWKTWYQQIRQSPILQARD
ncbi:MAG: hypothetical protein A2V70_19325 [Planctomycetes bacterium RBG_13_63_9]|nr:MAG: hypothetical protein A2V70_19325 [Planctomycetes bacterium RBG_13_63_9]